MEEKDSINSGPGYDGRQTHKEGRGLLCAYSCGALDRDTDLASIALTANGNMLTPKAVLKIKWVTLKSAYYPHKVTRREKVSPISVASTATQTLIFARWFQPKAQHLSQSVRKPPKPPWNPGGTVTATSIAHSPPSQSVSPPRLRLAPH